MATKKFKDIQEELERGNVYVVEQNGKKVVDTENNINLRNKNNNVSFDGNIVVPNKKTSDVWYPGINQKKDTRDNGWFKSPKAFDDGYQFGDITRTIAGTTADLATDVVSGIFGVGEGISDLWSYGQAEALDLIGQKELAQKRREDAQDNSTQEMSKWLKRQFGIENYSVLADKSDNVGQGLGNVAFMVATAGLGSSAGLGELGNTLLTSGITATSSSGSGMSEAYQGGATKGEATAYGLINGISEAGTELIFGGLGKGLNAVGIGKGLSSADDILAKKISSKFKNQLAKNLTEYTIKAGAEGTEEVMAGLLEAIGKKITYKSEEDLMKIIKDENLLDSFISGAITSGIAQTPGLVKTTKAGQDYITGYTKSEQQAFDNEVNRRVASIESNGKKLNKSQINSIEKQLTSEVESGKVNLNTTEAINKIETETGTKLSDFNKKYINAMVNAYQENFGGIPSTDRIVQDFGKIKDIQIENFKNQVVDMFPGLDAQHSTEYNQLVNSIAQVMWDTGASVRFDPMQNNIISYEGDQMIVNPLKTDMPIKNILTHEIIRESLENGEKNYIVNKLKEEGTYETYKNDLLSTGEFDEANVDMEIASQELENILRSDEELQELKQKDINLFNEIENTFDILSNQLTKDRNTKDSQFINEVYDRLNRVSKLEDLSVKNQEMIDNTKTEEKPLETDKNVVREENKIYDNLTDNIIKGTNSEKGDAHSDFFMDKTTDFDRNQGTTSDGKSFVLRIKKGDNEAKVSLTENDSKIWIDELYIKNQKQGYGKEIVDAIKDYAYEKGKEIETFKEVGSARQFWDKMFGEETRKGEFAHKYIKYKPEYWQNKIDEVQERIDRFTQWKENALNQGNQKLADAHQDSIDKEYKWLNEYKNKLKITNKELQEAKQPKQEFEKQTVEGEGTETRKTYESILKSENQTPEAKKIAKELIGTDTYVPDSNKNELQRADDFINKNGVEKSLETLRTNTENTRNNVDDIAIGNRLIEYYSKVGDKENLQEAIQLTAMAGTNVGRAVQAMSLINRQTPVGKTAWVQKTVDKLNNQLQQEYDKKHGLKGKLYQYDFTTEMQQKILNSTSENIDENVNEVLAELGEQVPMKLIDKLDTWRYFSMLSSPTTHIRNIVGNLTMGSIQDVKNKIRGGIEDIYYGVTGKEGERTSTLKFTPKEYKEFAKNDLPNVKERLSGSKYINPKSEIQKNQRMFKSDVAEKVIKKGLIDKTSSALDLEDVFGLNVAYKKSLAQYLYANKIDLKNITDKQLAQARNFAIDSAKQATFHQDNSLATALNTIENKNLASKLIVGGIIPFKKTPLNVAKTALEYNPAGLLKTLTVDSARLYQGKITANQYIDNISKGLTGTGIAMLGYALAQAGLIRTTSDDDESYDEDKGIQPYSIVLGDKTISLDWLSPTAVPMFVGAELYNQFNKQDTNMTEDEKENGLRNSVMNVLNASVSSLNPVSEMTMLSGIQDALKSYSGDYAKALEEMGVNTVTTYVNQFTPSILGKIAKTTDEYERSTTSTSKTTVGKAIDKIKNQTMSKLPGLRQTLPVKTDVWGNEIKQIENPLLRGIYNVSSPATIKNVRETELDKEINKLYEATGDSSVLPKTYITKEFTYDNKTYRLTSNEYATYKKILGEDNYEKLNKLIKSSEYKSLSNEEKAKVISQIYSYDRDAMKVAYSKAHNISYKDDSKETEKKVEALGGDVGEYYLYKAKIKEGDTTYEKREKLKNSDFSDSSKSAIYEASTSKSSLDLYKVLKENNVDINNYLDYLSTEFTSDKKEDGTTISGSKKNKIIDYLNNSDLTYEQKILIAGREFALDSESKNYVVYRIANSNLSANEKLELYKSYSWIKVLNNGEIRW